MGEAWTVYERISLGSRPELKRRRWWKLRTYAFVAYDCADGFDLRRFGCEPRMGTEDEPERTDDARDDARGAQLPQRPCGIYDGAG